MNSTFAKSMKINFITKNNNRGEKQTIGQMDGIEIVGWEMGDGIYEGGMIE